MLTSIHPKLPMRNKTITRSFYCDLLGFTDIGTADYPDYLLLQRDAVELHFFTHATLNPADNYAQVYIRTRNIQQVYDTWRQAEVPVHPQAPLQLKPWGQKEFSILDPDHNLLTLGEAVGTG
jgi:catechol 2,3-dioxygenase-like lactoylglutathione lyase family enzyme